VEEDATLQRSQKHLGEGTSAIWVNQLGYYNHN